MRIAHFSDLHYGTKTLVEADRCFGAAIDRAVALGVQAAVISGDATDHALDLHAPAAARLVAQVRRLADHCPVLMLQGTYSHEPPGTLSVFRSIGGRHPIHIADRIQQVALTRRGWVAPTLNLAHVDPECGDLDYIMGTGRAPAGSVFMNNNFAFGGINTSLLIDCRPA